MPRAARRTALQAPAVTMATSQGCLQLPIEPGPPREALETKRALGRIAAHGPHPGRARTRGSRADTRALEHGHGPPRIRAAEVKGRAQAHEAAAHDHDRHGGKPSLV